VINEPVGLATTATTWYLFAGLVFFWLLTFPLVVRSWRPATDIVMSLLGLSWIAFGGGILFRFVLLSYNSETFASPSLHLSELPSDAVDLALMTAGLFWLMFTIGAVTILALPVPRLLGTLLRQADRVADRPVMPAIVLCSICVVVSLLPWLPGALITPLSVIGSMWVIPATFVWTAHFSGRRQPGWLLAAVLMPGCIRLVLTPYRELILVMALVVVASAIYARRRLNPFVMAPLAVGLAVVSTLAVGSYRLFLWSDAESRQALTDRPISEFIFTGTGPLMENLQRFHVFDSLLLTVDLVPDVFPHADRNPLLEALTRGLVPRFLNPAKEQSDRAARFQISFWSYYNDPTLELEDATAAIAPSMPGSLYEAGGLRDVAVGGLLWAAVLAVLTRVMAQHRTPAAVGLYLLCAVQALAGIERDYAMAMSTLLQTLLVFFVLCALGLLAERRGELLPKPRTVRVVNT
jgi:hypothetical protein